MGEGGVVGGGDRVVVITGLHTPNMKSARLLCSAAVVAASPFSCFPAAATAPCRTVSSQ